MSDVGQLAQVRPARAQLPVSWYFDPAIFELEKKLLFEAGYNNTYVGSLFKYQPEVRIGACHTAFNRCPPGTGYGDIAKEDLILGTRWSASRPTAVATAPAHQPATSHVVVASLSYVSGAHNFKAGVQNRTGWVKDLRYNINGDIIQQYRNGRPSQVRWGAAASVPDGSSGTMAA